MAAGQQWLFAPAKPLVERLGKKFFRKIPARPGVYKMHDSTGNLLYVGKAKNLRQRLRSYRVANPERMPRDICAWCAKSPGLTLTSVRTNPPRSRTKPDCCAD